MSLHWAISAPSKADRARAVLYIPQLCRHETAHGRERLHRTVAVTASACRDKMKVVVHNWGVRGQDGRFGSCSRENRPQLRPSPGSGLS